MLAVGSTVTAMGTSRVTTAAIGLTNPSEEGLRDAKTTGVDNGFIV
jgi:hypothetical protein